VIKSAELLGLMYNSQ